MTEIEKIKYFLQEIDDISIGFSEINFFTADNLDKEQVGYSFDPNGNSLITGQSGDWKDGWIVVGNDDLGDPLFIDSFDSNLPVFTSQHGQGVWDAKLIANSLDKFKVILVDLRKLSVERESPSEIEENPISKTDLDRFFNKIKSDNSGLDILWWEVFLENDDE